MEIKPNSFTAADEKMYVEALNFLANEATFGKDAPKIDYVIKVRNHFFFLQSMITKIHANILEVKALHTKPEPPKKPSKSSKAK